MNWWSCVSQFYHFSLFNSWCTACKYLVKWMLRLMIHIHIYLVKWLLDTWVHYLVNDKIKVHFCWWNMNIYLSDFLDGLWIFCLQPLNHLVERARRPTRAPKVINEIDHQIYIFFFVMVPTVYVTSSHSLVGRCACLMCCVLVVRF